MAPSDCFTLPPLTEQGLCRPLYPCARLCAGSCSEPGLGPATGVSRLKSGEAAVRRQRSRCWIAQPTNEAPGQAIVFRGGRLGRVGLMSTAVEDCLHTTDSRRRGTSSRPPAAFWLAVRFCATRWGSVMRGGPAGPFSDHRVAMLGSYTPQEGQAYNGLVVAWPQIQRLAARVASLAGTTQEELF